MRGVHCVVEDRRRGSVGAIAQSEIVSFVTGIGRSPGFACPLSVYQAELLYSLVLHTLSFSFVPLMHKEISEQEKNKPGLPTNALIQWGFFRVVPLWAPFGDIRMQTVMGPRLYRISS